MDSWFYPTLYNGCNYLSMWWLKLINVIKRTPTHMIERPYLEAVLKASSKAGDISTMRRKGFLRVNMKYNKGRMMNPCVNKPTATVNMYQPSCVNDWAGSSIAAIWEATKNVMPIGEYLEQEGKELIYPTHWDKIAAFCRRHFRMHFLELTLWYFDSHFTEFSPKGSI